MPERSASGRSPLLVSSAIVVVITRVTPSMLPPTIITAPTSAAARPKPASTTVSSEKRMSHRSVSAAVHLRAPSERSCSRYSRQASSTICRESAAMIGRIRIVCAITIAVGVKRMPSCAERPGARKQQIDEEPDDDRRQAHQRVEEDDHRLPAAETARRRSPPRAAGRAATAIATALRLTCRLRHDDLDQLRVECPDQHGGLAKSAKNHFQGDVLCA